MRGSKNLILLVSPPSDGNNGAILNLAYKALVKGTTSLNEDTEEVTVTLDGPHTTLYIVVPGTINLINQPSMEAEKAFKETIHLIEEMALHLFNIPDKNIHYKPLSNYLNQAALEKLTSFTEEEEEDEEKELVGKTEEPHLLDTNFSTIKQAPSMRRHSSPETIIHEPGTLIPQPYYQNRQAPLRSHPLPPIQQPNRVIRPAFRRHSSPGEISRLTYTLPPKTKYVVPLIESLLEIVPLNALPSIFRALSMLDTTQYTRLPERKFDLLLSEEIAAQLQQQLHDDTSLFAKLITLLSPEEEIENAPLSRLLTSLGQSKATEKLFQPPMSSSSTSEKRQQQSVSQTPTLPTDDQPSEFIRLLNKLFLKCHRLYGALRALMDKAPYERRGLTTQSYLAFETLALMSFLKELHASTPQQSVHAAYVSPNSATPLIKGLIGAALWHIEEDELSLTSDTGGEFDKFEVTELNQTSKQEDSKYKELASHVLAKQFINLLTNMIPSEQSSPATKDRFRNTVLSLEAYRIALISNHNIHSPSLTLQIKNIFLGLRIQNIESNSKLCEVLLAAYDERFEETFPDALNRNIESDTLLNRAWALRISEERQNVKTELNRYCKDLVQQQRKTPLCCISFYRLGLSTKLGDLCLANQPHAKPS